MGELLIFDCDGVLVDSEILAIRAEARVLHEVGLPMTEDEIANTCVGLSYPDMMALLEARFSKPVPDGLEERIQEAAIAAFPTELREIDGMGEMLANSTVPRCVASSGVPERIALSLGITGLDVHFASDAIFSSTAVANGKPAPDLFLHAAAQMDVAADQCVVIEDSPHGITAARAAGMIAVALTAGTHIRTTTIDRLRDAGAHHIVSNVEALRTLIEERFT